jgi:MFS family permease
MDSIDSAGTVRAPARGLDAWLLGLCASRFFLTLIFMTYAATLPVLLRLWNMSAAAAGSISTGFQLGYAVSLLGFSFLADRAGARRLFLLSASISVVTAVAFAFLARSYWSALVLYTLVALSQGGTYTTAIMLIADHYPPQRRGGAIGLLIASSSMSHAASLLLSGALLPRGGYPAAFMAAAAGPVIALGVAWLTLRGTQNLVHPRAEGLRLDTEILRNPDAMRLTLGYTAHSWELLGMWAWMPAFLAASFARSGAAALGAAQSGAFLAASFHVMGLVASTSMGGLSDRLGRRRVLVALAATSTVCSLAMGWFVALPVAVVVAVGAAYGFTSLGDSPVLSVALTEAVRPSYLGAALALRSLLGFGAGALAPVVFGVVLDATNAPGGGPSSWGWAFSALGLGGLIATACAYGLRRRATSK